MSVYFVLQLRIFVMMRSINDVCYFVLEMFVMMGNISDVWFFFFFLKTSNQLY